MEPSEFDLVLDYDDVTEYMHDELLKKGYVPSSDELLDLGDIVFDLITQVLVHGGAEVHVMEKEVEDDE